MNKNKIDISKLDIKVILVNLYLTQFITLVLALTIFYFLHQLSPKEAILSVLPNSSNYKWLMIGSVYALIVLLVDIYLSKKLPESWMDDGGINERLFTNIPIWHIGIIAIIVGFIEEFLFRAALQPLLGLFLTSAIFTSIHFRYLNKWLLITGTFLISYGLGYIVEYTGEWSSAFVAHTLIDFVLGIFIRKKLF